MFTVLLSNLFQGHHKGGLVGLQPPLFWGRGGWFVTGKTFPYFELVLRKNESTFFNHQGLFMGETPIEMMYLYSSPYRKK